MAPFIPCSRFFPLGWMKTLARPKRILPSLWNVPLSIRIEPFVNTRFATRSTIILLTYDRSEFGNRICLWSSDESMVVKYSDRWRLVCNYLWPIVCRSSRVFHDVAVDIGDGSISDDLPESVFCFSRRIGGKQALLPNPYLMRSRRIKERPIAFDQKADTLYFRGSSTGHWDYEQNARVALCLAAKRVERSDCGISNMVQVDDQFAERIRSDGIERAMEPMSFMNRHRWIADVDGNTSSWDRYLSIATYGSIPIRFETQFEECWHDQLIEGEHYVAADRSNLVGVMDRLRGNPDKAKPIATSAQAFVRNHLSVHRIRELFERAWLSVLGM